MVLLKTVIGGQALIEGVMMRSPSSLAVAVRRPGGELVVKRDHPILLTERFPLFKAPLIRGIPHVFQTMVLGIKALNFSATQALDEEGDSTSTWGLLLVTFLALGVGLALFFYLPLLLAQCLRWWIPLLGKGFFFNLADGLFRLTIFLLYLFFFSFWGEIRKIFEYHGAEHMAVSAYEKGQDLTVANARKYSTIHPRCGTSFLLIVMAVSIILFSVLPPEWPFWAKLTSRLVLMPLVVGISYEVVKLGVRAGDRFWARFLIVPGLWLQRLTTRLPTDSQIEVAIAALREVLEMERGEFPAR